ncbi:diguanylate cyclase [Paenibacillus antri]|uniref:histidine kinase n=1 Tax=Paenibacillus antri TaxID=2582848 RepID=A0A5R9GAZ6_9BACL|nr:diguanylate cyclase [Paenibacillus antri]
MGRCTVVRELVVNASLLISGLYIGSLLFRLTPQSMASWRTSMSFGLYYGVVAAALLAFNQEGAGDGSRSFHLVPVAIAALHGSPRAAAIAAGFQLLLGWALPGVGLDARVALETAVVGLGAAAIAAVAKRRASAWAWTATLVAGSQLVGAVLDGAPREGRWWEAVVFASGILLVLWGADSFIRKERERKALMTEYTYLTQHDLLTGLLNFQTFQARLQPLLAEGNRVCFILIDCDDVKSLNTEQGFHTVDGTLRNVANLLRAYFPDALLMGRYGSDEFAVVFPMPDDLPARLEKTLETQIQELSDIQLSYGYAVYPDEAKDPSAFIALVQRRMLETKRRLWLEREAHWLHNERLMAVGELAAGMAHEIRNPLTTVKGFLQVSKQNGYNVSEYYDIIMHEIKRMSDLTVEFLQFSKPSAHRPSLISIQECVQAAVQLTESEITRNGHQLQLQAEEMPLMALLEKDKIIQVLVNVVRNGIEAMEEGGGTLAIAVYPRGEFGLVDVTDTGGGITDEHLMRLFQPFFSTKSKGTGLGLSISQKLINEHGGYISVRSKVGIGTTFTIRLPLADRDATA